MFHKEGKLIPINLHKICMKLFESKSKVSKLIELKQNYWNS